MQEEIEEKKRKTIIYRCYNNRDHKIDWLAENVIQAALKPTWAKIELLERSKTYGFIEVIMESAEVARLNSINPIKTDEVTLILMYMEWTDRKSVV